jgi:hypothetical protein
MEVFNFVCGGIGGYNFTISAVYGRVLKEYVQSIWKNYDNLESRLVKKDLLGNVASSLKTKGLNAVKKKLDWY